MHKMSMTFKEKQAIIEYLFVLAFKSHHGLMVHEKGSKLSLVINDALNRLTSEQRLIIQNDFIHKQPHLWYLEYFSRSTYYRLKNESMTVFLNCLGL